MVKSGLFGRPVLYSVLWIPSNGPARLTVGSWKGFITQRDVIQILTLHTFVICPVIFALLSSHRIVETEHGDQIEQNFAMN